MHLESNRNVLDTFCKVGIQREFHMAPHRTNVVLKVTSWCVWVTKFNIFFKKTKLKPPSCHTSSSLVWTNAGNSQNTTAAKIKLKKKKKETIPNSTMMWKDSDVNNNDRKWHSPSVRGKKRIESGSANYKSQRHSICWVTQGLEDFATKKLQQARKQLKWFSYSDVRPFSLSL